MQDTLLSRGLLGEHKDAAGRHQQKRIRAGGECDKRLSSGVGGGGAGIVEAHFPPTRTRHLLPAAQGREKPSKVYTKRGAIVACVYVCVAGEWKRLLADGCRGGCCSSKA